MAAISFLIDSPQIASTEVTLNASISGLTTSSCNTDGRCFLEGTLRQVGASKYFGFTQNNLGSWIDYQSSPEIEYIQNNFFDFSPISGTWSGQLKIKFSVLDSEYKGPGDYEIKIRRFSGKSQNPSGDSNILVSRLDQTIPTPTPSPTPTPTPSSTPTLSPTPTPTSTPTPSPTPTNNPTRIITYTPTSPPAKNIPSPTTILTVSPTENPAVLAASTSAKSSSTIPLFSTIVGTLASIFILILRFTKSRVE